MTLEKLTITPFDNQRNRLEKILVLFNPNTYTITKTVTWSPPNAGPGKKEDEQKTNVKRNAPLLDFGGGGSRHLTMDLFFDVTDSSILLEDKDVREETDKIVALTRITSEKKHPPVCEVLWGKPSEDFPFICVISSLTQRFTLFHKNGNPLRATLTVDFLEYLYAEDDERKTDPEQTVHMVKRGETLSSISGDLYHDPTLWRIIAEANRVDDPRQLTIGQTLAIPKYGQG